TVDPCGVDGLEALRGRHEKRWRLVGTDDARGMRIEGHHHGCCAALARHTPDAVENLAMPAMYAVEVAERKHRLNPPGRAHMVWKVDTVHSTWASAPPPGSVAQRGPFIPAPPPRRRAVRASATDSAPHPGSVARGGPLPRSAASQARRARLDCGLCPTLRL